MKIIRWQEDTTSKNIQATKCHLHIGGIPCSEIGKAPLVISHDKDSFKLLEGIQPT